MYIRIKMFPQLSMPLGKACIAHSVLCMNLFDSVICVKTMYRLMVVKRTRGQLVAVRVVSYTQCHKCNI